MKYKVHINVSETYSMKIFFFVPISGKKKQVLIFGEFQNDQSTKELFFNQFPLYSNLLWHFKQERYVEPIFLNLSYLVEIAAFQSLTKGSFQTEEIRMNGLFLLVINSQRLLPTRSFYFSAFEPKRSARSHRYVLPILHLERGPRNQPHTLYPISVILHSRLLVLSLFPRYPPLTPHLED